MKLFHTVSARIILPSLVTGLAGVLCTSAGRAADLTGAFAALDQQYAAEIRPLLKQYCGGCHNADKLKGDLDLERFAALADVRRDTRVWEKTLEQLHTGEMPPKDKPQPNAAEKEKLEKWIRGYLDTEGRSQAGDPGQVIMRRLSNAEYDFTVRDLTGVDLQPAKEFPIDGAAGEGFLNAGEALAMSPALLDKYLAAAKNIAGHAVLLPDGFRFSASDRQGDWTDEVIGRIRAVYARHSDAAGGTAINLQGIQFDTNTGGRLAVEKYLAVTLKERDALTAGTRTIAAAAAAHGLNEKYLHTLWKALTEGEPSILLKNLRARWRAAGPEDADALAAGIGQWQQALTRFQTVGHVRPWMVPADPLAGRQEIRVKLPPAAPGAEDVSLWLSASDAGDGAEGDVMVWERPRLAIPGRGEVLLRDLRTLKARLTAQRTRLFSAAESCLLAAAEALDTPGVVDRAALAAKHDIPPDVLAAWLDLLGVGAVGPGIDLFTRQLPANPTYEFIKGWGLPETPSMVTNASGQHVRVPGNMKPHAVALHPSPALAAVVAWQSPVTGSARVQGAVTHAHPECGNGVTWTLELRRGPARRKLAAGVAQGGNPVPVGPFENLAVQQGDLLLLSIGPRDGNHSCDLTDVELAIKSDAEGGREWNVSRDVSGSVLAGNPHADSYGNPRIWHFGTEPVDGASTAPVIPEGSVLARWLGTRDSAARRSLAHDLQVLLSPAGAPAAGSPDAALLRLLASSGSPLLSGPLPEGIAADGAPGLDASLFGKHPAGLPVDDAGICVNAPSLIEVRVPAGLAEGAEFVTSAALYADGKDGSVQAQVLTAKPADQPGLQPAGVAGQQAATGPWGSQAPPAQAGAPVLTGEGSAARKKWEQAFADFRALFPAALCYTKIIPVDEVITLTVFHREDEPLCRLMLSDAEKAELDRLWSELRFIGQDALTMVDAYAQLMEYATQDSNPGLFEHLREPLRKRAEELRQQMRAAEPRHLDALIDLADRAWRRRLTEPEQHSLREFYHQLRADELPHEEAFALTIARVLVAPAFLYRAEQPAEGDKPQPVSDPELASRLSYFLWSSMPDNALRSLADSGKLHEPEHYRSAVKQMLQDERIRALAREFACQWLHIRDVATLDEKSERHFPTFNPLRADLEEEAVRFFTDLFQRDGSVLDVLDADYTFVNEALAGHYGLPGVKGEGWRRIEGVRAQGRGGVLGMAAVLAKQSGASRTSPILRGNWIVETLLGDRLPKPPKGVPPLPENESDGDLTVRQITERHTSDANCAGCHVRIDPFGYALEEFDAIGRKRDRDLGNRPIDAGVRLPDGTEVNGAEGLRQYLLTIRREDFLRTFCRRLLGFALGRSLRLSDMPLVDEMTAALAANGYRFSAALDAVLLSPQFRMQRGLEATRPAEQ